MKGEIKERVYKARIEARVYLIGEVRDRLDESGNGEVQIRSFEGISVEEIEEIVPIEELEDEEYESVSEFLKA